MIESLTEYNANKAHHLDNQDCIYCGKFLDELQDITKEHVVGRRFVPKGVFNGQWNLIANACQSCNGIKADLENDISAITMHPDAIGKHVNDDPLFTEEAKRKSKNAISRTTGKPVWALSWLVRIGLIKRLEKAALLMLKTSYLFDWLGSASSAFHMELSGKDKEGSGKVIKFELTARSGDGPYIPCMPAILMAKKLAADEVKETGAYPCMGFITKDEYLSALSDMDISWAVASGSA